MADGPFALDLSPDIEMVEIEDDAAQPAAELASGESVPSLLPARAGWSGIRLSRSRLVVLGALAFSAGILTSAGARTLVKAPRPMGAVAAAPTTAVAPTVTTPAVEVERTIAAPTASPPGAVTEARPTVAANLAAADLPSSVIANEVRAKDARAANVNVNVSVRPRGRSAAARPRALRRAASAGNQAAIDTPETDAPGSASAAPAAHDSPSWVDPFAE